MKKIIDFKDNRGVMSLIVILGIGFFVLAIVLTLTGQIVVEIIRGRNTVSGNQSFYTAEAAVREGVYQYLATTSYTSGTPELINNVSEGSISVTTSTIGVAHREVIGTAKNNLTNRKVIYTVYFKEGLAFEYAIFSASNIELGGNAKTNWDTFSNGTTTFKGSAVVGGDAFAFGGFVEKTCTKCGATGLEIQAEDPINFPTVNINIDFNYYRTEAENNPAEPGGTVYTNVNLLRNYLHNNNRTGVMFASTTNTVNIGGPFTYLLGSLVTLGDLDINNGEFVSTGDYKAIVVAGDFTNNGGTIRGDVYVAGNFDIQGGEIEGNVYVGGNFDMQGGKIKGIVYVEGTTSAEGNWTIEGAIISIGGVSMKGTPPSGGVIYNPDIVANWFDFITITNPPKIIGWREE